MLPRKMFKVKGLRLAKNTFPENFSLEKPDKNKSALGIALKFGCFKKLSSGLGGAAAIFPPAPR